MCDDVSQEDNVMKEGYHLISEGKVSLYSPRKITASSPPAPLSTKTAVFYNPAMIFNRDVSVLVLSHLLLGGMSVLDGLSATGVRGLRYAKELEVDASITFNDRSREAVNLILKNIALNFSENTQTSPAFIVKNQDLNTLLHSEKFDCIDIDPFGSPVRFFDSSMRSLRKNGILAVTATDTSTLCGSYPRTSLRRYGSWVPRNPFTHETGVRNLIAAVVGAGASYNKALTPLLSHATHYYYRVYFRAEDSKEKTDELLTHLGYLRFSRDSSRFQMVKFPEIFGKTTTNRANTMLPDTGKEKLAGPLWLGTLFKEELLDKLVKSLADFSYLQSYPAIQKKLELWRGEAGFEPFFYRTDRLSSQLKHSQPRMERLFQRLKERGFLASRTHFDPYGIKTDASYEDVVRVFEDG